MTKIAYDVTNVESSTGEQPKPGIYPATIASARQRDQKSDGSPANDIEIGFDLGPEYVRRFTYIQLDEASLWKMKELINALGLKGKGNLDLTKIVGKKVRVKINADSYDGEYKGKVGTILKAKAGKDEEESEEEPETEEPEEDEDEDEVDLDELDRKELKAFISENDLDIKVTKGMSEDDIRAKITEALSEDDEEEEEDEDDEEDDDDSEEGEEESEEEDEEEDEEGDDYDTWTLAQLKSELKQRELTKKVKSPVTKDKAIKALRKDDNEEPF